MDGGSLKHSLSPITALNAMIEINLFIEEAFPVEALGSKSME
jgi:hypothetical protein